MHRDGPPTIFDPDGPPAGVFLSSTTTNQPRWRLHLLLFAATLTTSTFCGGLYYGRLGGTTFVEQVTHPRFLVEGLAFAVPLLLILLAHEAGHYVAAKLHELRATPPFFLPMPIPLPFSPGTLGAVIRVKDSIRSRRQLLDVGAAGPLAGFVVLLPVLVIGGALSTTQTIDVDQDSVVYFGEPILFRLLVRGLFFADLGPGEDIALHPIGWAAWWGLLVTALNMLPFFQLDGGHVWYALFGRLHDRIAVPLTVLLIPMGWWFPGWWLWFLILQYLGPRHPPLPADEDRLDPARTAIGWAAIIVFVLSFSPIPIAGPDWPPELSSLDLIPF